LRELAFLALALALPEGARAATVRVLSPLTQVFPTTPPAGRSRAIVEAARGEYEPFQILVHADDAALTRVRATASALSGPGRLAAPRLYRVDYLVVRTPSSIEGSAGPWPDPLIPDVDAYTNERRRAFPFDVPRGESRAIWVELYVPEATAPGRYQGTVTVEGDGLAPVSVPVELTVHRFTIPATSSLPVTFGMNARALPFAHPGKDGARLQRLYTIAALRHRVSLHGLSFEPAPWTARPDGTVAVDFAPYDAEVGPFLDGTADPSRARWSAFDLRIPQKLDGRARESYVRQMVDHLRARGWLSRVFDYTWDEPSDAMLPDVRARAERLHRVAPEIPRLVTKEFTTRLDGSVDIWCPVVNYLDDKPGWTKLPVRSDYEARIARGERLWWYHACMSHGCNIVGGDYFTGWPSLAVDAPAVSHRIFEWLTFRYHVGGELYYNTVEAYARHLDPWRDQLLFGGNGDGTLFYPGRPSTIGGESDIPVESIRLKLVREGLEDYEYLRLYGERFGRAAADELAASIAPQTYRWVHDGDRLLAARHRIAAALDGAHADLGGLPR
jgi:hypothetical protein